MGCESERRDAHEVGISLGCVEGFEITVDVKESERNYIGDDRAGRTVTACGIQRRLRVTTCGEHVPAPIHMVSASTTKKQPFESSTGHSERIPAAWTVCRRLVVVRRKSLYFGSLQRSLPTFAGIRCLGISIVTPLSTTIATGFAITGFATTKITTAAGITTGMTSSSSSSFATSKLGRDSPDEHVELRKLECGRVRKSVAKIVLFMLIRSMACSQSTAENIALYTVSNCGL